MDKALLTKQLEIVKNLPPGQTHPFTVEGAGVLRAFVQSRATRPDLSAGEQALHAKINTLLKIWAESGNELKPPAPAPGQEKRTQLALREAIDKVNSGQFEAVSHEEVKLLKATHEVFSRRSETDSSANPRLRDLLKATLDKIEANRDRLVNVPATTIFETTQGAGKIEPASEIVNDLMADKAFKDIQKTSLARVEDIEMGLNVRVFEFKGNTRVAGDIPSDVMVKVEDGELTVSGFVAGYLIADGDIRIEGNVQGGGAISNHGSIELERSLMGAKVVAKRGNITCDHLESPAWAFAWEKVTVNGPCMAGPVTAGAISVHGKVTAATLSSCGHVEAAEFGVSSRADTVVYLSNVIKCEDYNREMPGYLEDRFRQIVDLQRKIAKAEESDGVMLRFIHNMYRTGLFYLLGGVESATTAQGLQGKQIRALYLGQVISFATSVSKFYKNAADNPEEFGADVIEDFDMDARDTLQSITKDVEAIPEEFGATHRRYLLDRIGELKSLMKSMVREYTDHGSSETLNGRFLKLMSEWRSDHGDLERDIRKLIDDFGLEKEVLERIEHEPEQLEDMLQSTLEEKMNSTDGDAEQRAKSPLVSLLRRSADRSKRTIENSLNRVERHRRELKEIVRDLEKEGAVKFAPNIPSATLVKGDKFAPGVIITASNISRSGRDTNLARVIVLEDEITQETTFVLKDKMIQRLVSS